MKVIYITHSSGLQGAGFALLNIIKSIKSLGITPIIVLPKKGIISDEVEKLNIKYYTCPCCNYIYPSRTGFVNFIKYPVRLLRIFLFDFFAKKKLNRIVSKEKPDIIHSNSGVIRFGAKVAKDNEIPHVWHIREYQTLDFGWIPIGGVEYQRSLYNHKNNHCIAITKDVFKYFNLNDNKDKVIYDGVFPNDIILPDSNPQHYFLFVGCLKESKGIMDAVLAFEKIVNEIPIKFELWLAGKDEININEIINNTSCKDRIKYLGFRNDIYQLMANAKALIVPSRFEGFGFITTEAMLNKCLVIGRNTGGTKEQFDNGLKITGKEIGLRFNTIEELSNNIKNVANPQYHYDDIINRAYSVVKTMYTNENNVNNIYNFYNQII